MIKIRETESATEWVNDLLNGAVAMGVTDLQVNLHRADRALTVRVRSNRVMREVAYASGQLAVEITNRIKTAAQIPTGPAKAPADGLYEHDTGFSKHELRVALFPSVLGEAIAMRLPASQEMPVLSDVKFNDLNLARLKELLGMANGLVLMAGPMGAGKTTTMYGVLGEMGGPDKNVFTVEDPVERLVPGAIQIQINANSQNGWPEVLKSLRRSDLEVLMIGEVRTSEQAEAALEIGNSGVKVLSSIHANDSLGAVYQLLELAGSSPRMIGNQLRGVISQRLLRKLHLSCSGSGCDDCEGGYKGVQPIHEVLLMRDEITQALVDGLPVSEVRDVVAATGMETLWQAAHRLIDEGVTDYKEAERVLGLEPNMKPAVEPDPAADTGEPSDLAAPADEAPAGIPTPPDFAAPPTGDPLPAPLTAHLPDPLLEPSKDSDYDHPVPALRPHVPSNATRRTLPSVPVD